MIGCVNFRSKSSYDITSVLSSIKITISEMKRKKRTFFNKEKKTVSVFFFPIDTFGKFRAVIPDMALPLLHIERLKS